MTTNAFYKSNKAPYNPFPSLLAGGASDTKTGGGSWEHGRELGYLAARAPLFFSAQPLQCELKTFSEGLPCSKVLSCRLEAGFVRAYPVSHFKNCSLVFQVWKGVPVSFWMTVHYPIIQSACSVSGPAKGAGTGYVIWFLFGVRTPAWLVALSNTATN